MRYGASLHDIGIVAISREIRQRRPEELTDPELATVRSHVDTGYEAIRDIDFLGDAKIWIDRFQTSLAIQIACYCVLYQIIIWFSVMFEQRIHAKVDTLMGPAGGAYFSALMMVPIVALVFMIMAAIAANKGEPYRYPVNIRLIK